MNIFPEFTQNNLKTQGRIIMEITISNVHGREIIDSRGNPTVEAEVTLIDGSYGRAAVRAVLLLEFMRHTNFVIMIK